MTLRPQPSAAFSLIPPLVSYFVSPVGELLMENLTGDMSQGLIDYSTNTYQVPLYPDTWYRTTASCTKFLSPFLHS